MAYEHRTGRVNSGDVTLFYRIFGKPGATPILILHGSNYYDSVDWIEVASALATDREEEPAWVHATCSVSMAHTHPRSRLSRSSCRDAPPGARAGNPMPWFPTAFPWIDERLRSRGPPAMLKSCLVVRKCVPSFPSHGISISTRG